MRVLTARIFASHKHFEECQAVAAKAVAASGFRLSLLQTTFRQFELTDSKVQADASKSCFEYSAPLHFHGSRLQRHSARRLHFRSCKDPLPHFMSLCFRCPHPHDS